MKVNDFPGEHGFLVQGLGQTLHNIILLASVSDRHLFLNVPLTESAASRAKAGAATSSTNPDNSPTSKTSSKFISMQVQEYCPLGD